MTDVVIRTMQGLGDCVYTFPIVEYYAEKNNVVLKTDYPIIFDALDIKTVALNDSIESTVFPRYSISQSGSHYMSMLQSGGVGDLPFVFKWNLGFTTEFKDNYLDGFLIKYVKSKKKLCVFKEPCLAHIHKMQNDSSLTPDVEEFQDWIFENSDKYFFVSVGHDEVFKKRMRGIDIDLNNKTSIQNLITICSMADMIATQSGHLIPLAQGFKKKLKIFYPEKIVDEKFKNINEKTFEVL